MSLLPQGNPLMPPGVVLAPADLKTIRGNFQSQSFSGYLTWGTRPGRRAYAFWANGEYLRSFEDRNQELRVLPWEELILQSSDSAASYYLPAAMARVLSTTFAMERDKRSLKPGEARALVSSLEKDKSHALARLRYAGQDLAVIWEAGQAVQVRLTARVGQVVSSRAALQQLWDELESQGGELDCYFGPSANLEARVARLEREQQQRTAVVPKGVSGFFASKDTAKFDADILKAWNLGQKTSPTLIVEDLEGRQLGTVKSATAAGKGEVLEVPAKILASWELGGSDKVVIRPLCE